MDKTMAEDNVFIDSAEPIEIEGKYLKIKYCSFGDFLDLKRAALSNLKIKLDSSFFSRKLDGSLLAELAEPLLGLLGNREFDEVLFKLALSCSFDDRRITKDFFEDPQHRRYYFPLMTNILLENLKVFLPGNFPTE
jgi:hypothetical protein